MLVVLRDLLHVHYKVSFSEVKALFLPSFSGIKRPILYIPFELVLNLLPLSLLFAILLNFCVSYLTKSTSSS